MGTDVSSTAPFMGIKVGDNVEKTRDGPGRAGHFIVVGENREEALKRAEEASKMVSINVQAV